MLGRTQETTISSPQQTVSFARPVSAEAQKVREGTPRQGPRDTPDRKRPISRAKVPYYSRGLH